MKNITTIALSFLVYLNVNAQADSVKLLPDQNPNFQKSRTRYMEQSAALTQNQGQTIQETYKAIDDVQAKKERKELAQTRRHERRMARIQSRGYRRGVFGPGYYDGFDNYGYNNYGNQPYGYAPYHYPRPNYLGPNFNPVNSAINSALLGLTLWSILRR